MDCVFCKIASKEEPALIIYEDDLSLAFLDKHPQTKGHIQLIPKDHYTWIYEVSQMGRLFTTVQTIIHAIIPVLKADHVTLATFGHQVRHAHVWIVPQYKTTQSIYEGKHNMIRELGQEDLARELAKAITKEVSV